MARKTKWTITLFCTLCRSRFTLRHLKLQAVFKPSLVTACPRCGTELHLTSGPSGPGQTQLHRIDLREETESIYRKTGDSYTWHFSEKCTRWPTDNYLQLEIQPSVGQLCGECRTKQMRVRVH